MNATPVQTVLPNAESHSLPAPLALGFQSAWMLAKREWIRFFRQPFRIIAALGQPVLFWILFGTGLHGAFRGPVPDESYMSYFLPGTTALIVLFTAIFSTITVIEDRREGFLQGVLVAPPGRWSIVLGKTLGCAAIAWAQSLAFLTLAWATGMLAVGWNTVPMLLFLFLAAFALAAFGFLFAWPMESTQGYHAFMNLILIPMWLMSGAFFPIPSIDPGQPVGQSVLHWIMKLNPMTYFVGGLRHYLDSGFPTNTSSNTSFWSVGLAECWWVTCLFTALVFSIAMLMVRRRQKGEFQ
jgi:ABC-2 type transport system permease protein